MKRLITICAASIFLLIPYAALSATTDDVQIQFVSGMGIKMEIRNYENDSIYNVSLNKIDIRGMVILGLSPGIDEVKEVESGSIAYLSFIVFGIGFAYINAHISYEIDGNIVEKEIQCEAEIIGPLVLIIEQW